MFFYEDDLVQLTVYSSCTVLYCSLFLFFSFMDRKKYRMPANVRLGHTWCNWRQMRKLNKKHAVTCCKGYYRDWNKTFIVLKVSEQQATYIKTTLLFFNVFCRSKIRLTQVLCNYNTRLLAQAVLFTMSNEEALCCCVHTLPLKPPQLKNAATDKSCLDVSKGQN